MEIRAATIQDIDSFRDLWMKFMRQQAEEGSLVIPNQANLRAFTDLFRFYASHEDHGLVLLVSDDGKDIGIQMDGVPPYPLDLTIGKYTMLWGTYLEPEYRGKGITHQIYETAMKWTHEHRFTGGISGILVGDQRVEDVLSKVVDGKHGASDTKAFTVEVSWEFDTPTDRSTER